MIILVSYSYEVVTEDVAGFRSAVLEDDVMLFLALTLFFHPDSEFLTFSEITDFLNLDPIYTITLSTVREKERKREMRMRITKKGSQTCVTMT